MRSRLLVGGLAFSLLAPAAARAQGVTIDHQEIGCIVAGKYPKLNACFSPASTVKKARVYFRPETLTQWYYVDMTTDAPCHKGILLRPSKALIDKHIFYYVDVQGEGTARTPEYAPVVVASEENCRKKLPVAPLSATGPAAVGPSFPPFFLGGGGLSTGVVAGGVAAAAAVAGGVKLLTDDGGPSVTTPPTVTPTNPPATAPPTTTPPTTVPPPSGLVVSCTATPRTGDAPLRVSFATFPSGGTGSYTFLWSFGDGDSNTNPNPSHTFLTPGLFNSTVQATSGSQAAACSREITVTPPPTPPPPTTLPATFKLSVSTKGSGTGTVTGPGINCPGDCTETYTAGTVVNLTATPDATRVPTVFKDWAGDCSGTVNPCVLTMTADKNVTAQFELLRSLNLAGGANSSVAGSVASNPAGTPPLGCTWTGVPPPTVCLDSATFINGTTVRLTVTTGGATTVWTGCTTTAGPTCDVLMDANKSVSVDTTTPFAPPPPAPASSRLPVVFSTLLEVSDGEGQLVMNGRGASAVRAGLASNAEGGAGTNRVEAVLARGAGRSGTWRFDFSGLPAFKPGSLRVVAGTVAVITPDAVVFRLQGKPGERVVFTFEVEN